jgi:Fe-S cluster assembly protein SufD
VGSLSGNAVRGVGREALDRLLAEGGAGSISERERYDALARYHEMPVRIAGKPSRSWKYDLAKLDLSEIAIASAVSRATLPARRDGVTIEPFSLARERGRNEFERAFGRAVDTRDDKFASLALAFQNDGLFVSIPAGAQIDEPIVLEYAAGAAALFPYTLVAVGAGARVTLLERLGGSAGAPLVCGITELVAGDGARVTYAVDQRTSGATKAILTRRATLGADAVLGIGLAELGGALAVSRLRIVAAAPGARAETSAAFFATGDQHVDIETEVIHAAGHTTSDTVVRSVGTGRGQGRYLGNIKILAHAHGAEASLKDDALLLSGDAHIESVPALEIAANDVKAFHGATVGCISEDELFYAQTRGIPRPEAERMIALGFFEPAVSRFPGEALRAALRAALANKLGSAGVS